MADKPTISIYMKGDRAGHLMLKAAARADGRSLTKFMVHAGKERAELLDADGAVTKHLIDVEREWADKYQTPEDTKQAT